MCCSLHWTTLLLQLWPRLHPVLHPELTLHLTLPQAGAFLGSCKHHLRHAHQRMQLVNLLQLPRRMTLNLPLAPTPLWPLQAAPTPIHRSCVQPCQPFLPCLPCLLYPYPLGYHKLQHQAVGLLWRLQARQQVQVCLQ
jgi:hypothetical protein